jgi:hypothetical protein
MNPPAQAMQPFAAGLIPAVRAKLAYSYAPCAARGVWKRWGIGSRLARGVAVRQPLRCTGPLARSVRPCRGLSGLVHSCVPLVELTGVIARWFFSPLVSLWANRGCCAGFRGIKPFGRALATGVCEGQSLSFYSTVPLPHQVPCSQASTRALAAPQSGQSPRTLPLIVPSLHLRRKNSARR